MSGPAGGGLSSSDFERAGLWEPEAVGADDRLELLRYLVQLGATEADLDIYREDLSYLAGVLALRGPTAMTVAEASERSGLPEEKIIRFARAAGFPTPGPDDRVLAPEFVSLAAAMSGDGLMFGEDAVLSLVRVMGAAMARLADAIVSAFLVNVEPSVVGPGEATEMDWARANVEATALLPVVASSLDLLLRAHLIAARRTGLGDRVGLGYETQELGVGFVDLVDYIGLAQRLTTPELGGVLTDFEHLAADLITQGGGRVIKLIGDEVMFTVPDDGKTCAIALALVAACGDHLTIPGAKAGLARGWVMLRDGDVFGPVVNLAARAASVAGPGEVVATAELADRAAMRSMPLGSRSLKGFDAPVELCLLLGPTPT